MRYEVFDTIDLEQVASWSEEAQQRFMEETFQSIFDEKNQTEPSRLNDLLQMEFVSCSYAEKRLTVRVPTLPWEQNPNGTLHGGMIAVFIDSTCGLLVRFCRGVRKTVTVGMTTNFLASASIGDHLLVSACIKKMGNRLAFLETEVIDDRTGKIVATAMVTFL